MSQQKQRFFYPKLKLVSIVLLVFILIITNKHLNLQQAFAEAIIWVESLGTLGPIAFIAIYNLATLLFVPGSILTLKGGCLFGLFWGSIYVIIASTLGATFAFLIGRYFSRNWVRKKITKNPQFQAIDKAIAKEGFKIVLLTRLSPVFPFNLLNYVLGVTQVSLKDYILGSIGMIPGTILYVYIGSLATDLTRLDSSNLPNTPETQIARWVIQGIGLIAFVIVTVYITKIARKALNESVVTTQITEEK
ncbi:TVP38/TMEM64 family protein [Mastigocoleus testarum]|uniref:TVP38/TMEM64 family membrane protein n=1 Tax=Mastigocoleus testarum BC008 TaxID=371196 RepID=A0A0V7ZFC5_9CYAN|nr:TVP38/TMEM64 family protein [Mastigocoleus testarum]KST63246.1 SNARE associated Golgi family protein [Mastigocoleus testarum BC008]